MVTTNQKFIKTFQMWIPGVRDKMVEQKDQSPPSFTKTKITTNF